MALNLKNLGITQTTPPAGSLSSLLPNPSISSTSNNISSSSNITISTKFKMDLKDILNIAGITLPATGSLDKYTGSISFEEISGTIVDIKDNTPIKGVKVYNIFSKSDTTNEFGSFKLEHPNILETPLPPNKFPIYFSKGLSKPRYKDLKFIPYTSTKDLQLNVGIIQMNPKESNLKKEIIEFFRFPEVEEIKYTRSQVTFEFHTQKKINDSINDLKVLMIPLIIGMIEAYGVTEVKKLLEDIKKNPTEAINSIKNQLLCPTPEERKKIIDQKNKLLKKLLNIQKVLTSSLQTLIPIKVIIDATDVVFNIIRFLPLPTAFPPGIGLPSLILNGFSDLMNFLKKLIAYSKHIIDTTVSILILLEVILILVISLLQLLDYLMQLCSIEEISDEINGNSPSSLINDSINNIREELNKETGTGTGLNSPFLIQNINNIQNLINTIINENSSLDPNSLTSINQNSALNTLNLLTNQIFSNQSPQIISSTLNNLQNQTNLISISSSPTLIAQTNQVNQFAISNQLTDLTNQNLKPISDINGFLMDVESENTPSPIKRRRAIAKNKQNIIMLTGEWSYSSIDQILIDELVFYIQQNDLKAD
jgi:hypothetical protein